MRPHSCSRWLRRTIAAGALTLGPLAAAAPGVGEPLRLAPHDTRGALPLEQALHARRSLRAFSARPLTLAQAGQLLWAAQGRTTDDGRRTAPSAGARYPLELHLAVGAVEGLRPGVYRYLPASHALLAASEGDVRPALASAAVAQTWLQRAPALVVVTARPERTTSRYGARTERYVALEAGAAVQNLLLQAVALGLGGTLVGAFDDAALRRVLALSEGEVPLAIVPIGVAG